MFSYSAAHLSVVHTKSLCISLRCPCRAPDTHLERFLACWRVEKHSDINGNILIENVKLTNKCSCNTSLNSKITSTNSILVILKTNWCNWYCLGSIWAESRNGDVAIEGNTVIGLYGSQSGANVKWVRCSRWWLLGHFLTSMETTELKKNILFNPKEDRTETSFISFACYKL